MKKFKSGNIVRVKHGVNWHPDFIGRAYIIYCINVTYDKKLDYKLVPYGDGHRDTQPIFITKEDSLDIVKVTGIEPQMFIKKLEL